MIIYIYKKTVWESTQPIFLYIYISSIFRYIYIYNCVNAISKSAKISVKDYINISLDINISLFRNAYIYIYIFYIISSFCEIFAILRNLRNFAIYFAKSSQFRYINIYIFAKLRRFRKIAKISQNCEDLAKYCEIAKILQNCEDFAKT